MKTQFDEIMKEPEGYDPGPDFIKPNKFTKEELPIAEFIQKRRLQILVHSYIYYEMDYNIISDKQYDEWSKELVIFQNKNPEIASRICYPFSFADFDGTTGFNLPKDAWVKKKAMQLYNYKK